MKLGIGTLLTLATIAFLGCSPEVSTRNQDQRDYEQVDLSEADRAFLDEMAPLQVIVDDVFSPITYYDEETGEFGGIAIDVLRILSNILSFDYQIIRDENLTWSERLDLIRNDEVHLMGGASINQERMQYGYFTENAYFVTHYSLIGSIDNHIVIRELSDVSRYKLGLTEDVTINEYILSNLTDDSEIVYFESNADSLAESFDALRRGEVDLVPENESVFKEEYFSGTRFDFEIVYPMLSVQKRYSFFTPKTEEGNRLVSILDIGMDTLNIDEIVSARYDNKSLFAFYRERTEEIQQADALRNLLLTIVSIILPVTVVVILITASKNRQLKYLVDIDSLTGLGSRHALFRNPDASRSFIHHIVYCIDLDDFKPINDKYGHKTGDMVLKEISNRLANFRPKARAYRIGGDEFIYIVPETEHFEADELVSLIGESVMDGDRRHQVHASVGYVRPSDFDMPSVDFLLNLVDFAMYRAKKTGKNRSVQATADLAEEFMGARSAGDRGEDSAMVDTSFRNRSD